MLRCETGARRAVTGHCDLVPGATPRTRAAPPLTSAVALGDARNEPGPRTVSASRLASPAPRRSRRPRIGALVSAPPLTPGSHSGDDEAAGARAAGLIAVAEDLAGEFSLRPLLERILLRCTELLGCDAGSICSVDEAAGTYRKEADIGVACQSGHVFPLTEGMTGAVVARRGPSGSPGTASPRRSRGSRARATLRGVIGVPLEWRGRIIGACIVFSRDRSARSARRTPSYCSCSPSMPRSHWPTPGCTRGRGAGQGRGRVTERERLLHEVHDTITQRLVSVRVHIETADSASPRHPAAPPGAGRATPSPAVSNRPTFPRHPASQASAAARDALAEARLTLLGLASSPLDGRTLDAALQSEASWAESIGRLEVRLVSAGRPSPWTTTSRRKCSGLRGRR